MIWRLRYNFVFAVVFTLATVLAEQVFFYYQFRQLLGGLVAARFALFVFPVGLVLSLVAQRSLVIAVIMVLAITQMVQATHIDYFGAPITPDIIGHFFHQPLENLTEVVHSVYLQNAIPAALIAVTMFAGWQVGQRIYRHTLRFRYAFVLLAAAAVFPYHIMVAAKPHKYYPQPAETLISNFVNALSLRFLRDEFTVARAEYQPYQLTRIPTSARNIVLIIGESCNPDYMSLFGYHENSTPLLAKMQQEEGNRMLVRQVFSSSVSTFPSISLLMNIIREPGNLAPIEKKEHNLMRLAKAGGFRTAWIGNQSANNLVYAGLEVADFMHISQATSLFRPQGHDDDVLLETLKNQPLGPDSNFIVIHQRNLHSPYELNYRNHPELQLYSDDEIAHAPDRATHARKTYLNAMRYNDYTLVNLFNHLKANLSDKGESYIVYTSDHSELLGEDGVFGHSLLEMRMARVPLIVLGVNPDPEFMRTLRDGEARNHYELMRIIAAKLGTRVDNPNAANSSYYLHSPNMYGNGPFIEYQLDDGGKITREQRKFPEAGSP